MKRLFEVRIRLTRVRDHRHFLTSQIKPYLENIIRDKSKIDNFYIAFSSAESAVRSIIFFDEPSDWKSFESTSRALGGSKLEMFLEVQKVIMLVESFMEKEQQANNEAKEEGAKR